MMGIDWNLYNKKSGEAFGSRNLPISSGIAPALPVWPLITVCKTQGATSFSLNKSDIEREGWTV